MQTLLPNDQLQLTDIPPPNADWQSIASFAHTFHGYQEHGSFEKAAELANARKRDTLTELCTCLFLEARRWRHYGDVPQGEDLDYICSLVEGIREKVKAASPGR